MFSLKKRLAFMSGIPHRFYRKNIKLPVIYFLSDIFELYKTKTIEKAHSAKELLIRAGIILAILSSLIWLSILLYIAFYYAYVPYVLHAKPVHLTFDSCAKTGKLNQCMNKNVCSYPNGYVKLTSHNQLLMPGQPYKIVIELDMPESPCNTDQGMFMVCAEFRSRFGELVEHSCRSTLLNYQSPLLSTLKTIIYSPGLIFGSTFQKQKVVVELFSEYEDDELSPVTDVYVEIQSHSIEVYSATFVISAHFSGLRYLMYHWPIMSAVVGIMSNLFFIVIVCMITWYQIVTSEEYKNYQIYKEKHKFMKPSESEGSSSFVGEVNLLQEMDDSSDDNSTSVRKRRLMAKVETLQSESTC